MRRTSFEETSTGSPAPAPAPPGPHLDYRVGARGDAMDRDERWTPAVVAYLGAAVLAGGVYWAYATEAFLGRTAAETYILSRRHHHEVGVSRSRRKPQRTSTA
jgi:hypothetical protein